MDNKQLETSNISNLFKLFLLSLTNTKIYPITSPIVENYISELYNVLKQILRETTLITLSEMDSKIFVNAEKYSGKDSISMANLDYLTQPFIQTGFKSITFKKELLLEELKNFIIAIVTKKPGTPTKEIIKQFVQKNNIRNVSIDKVEYITVLKSDKIIKNIIQKISQPVSNLNELIDVLNTVLHELEKLPNEETQKKVSSMIAKQISTLDSYLLCELLTNSLPLKLEQSGLKNEIINNLTKQDIEEILNEIILWCKKLRNQVESKFEYIKKLQSFKNFISFVINSAVSEILPFELFEELFKIGLIDALPEAIKQKKEEQKSWISQLDELLETKQPEKLLQEKFLFSLKENIEKLCIIGLDDKVETIISLMTENLSNPVVKVRLLAASSIYEISNQLTKNSKSKISKNLISRILNFLFKEKEKAIINLYLYSLEKSFMCLINCKDYSSFNNFVKQMLLNAQEIQKTEPSKYKSIYYLIEKIFINKKEKILNRLIQEVDTKITNEILWFLNYIVAHSIETTIEAIFNISNQEILYKPQDLIISMNNKREVIGSILAYLSLITSQYKISKIVDLIEKIDYDFSEALKQIYPYVRICQQNFNY